MAYDHADRVKKLCVLDIAPTREMYANTSDEFARAYWHWFFMILPAPEPERMMQADPDAFWLARCAKNGTELFDEALDEYLSTFRDPETIRATCDDYRAAATIDITHDDAETHKLPMPVRCLWGAHGAGSTMARGAQGFDGRISEAQRYEAAMTCTDFQRGDQRITNWGKNERQTG